MSEQLYAVIGRKQVALDSLNAEYDNLLAMLGQVASGEISPQRVKVDLTARNWVVSPPEPTA